jgi:branched-chain amino acid transport system ATP-binding protein
VSLLVVDNLTKRFGGLVAVNAVSFTVHPGEILSVIGPNGAGKTTLFNMLTGIYAPSTGSARLGGAELCGRKPHRIVEAGLARTFQNIRLFGGMSVLENVMVGRHSRTRGGFWSALLPGANGRREEVEIAERARSELEFVGLAASADRQAATLSYGDQRRLEIARALATDPQLLLLDEPAAGMNPQETGDLISLIRAIQTRGITVVLIEHDMGLVMRLSDRIVVMNFGQKIADGPPTAVRTDPQVIAAYLGGAAADGPGEAQWM